MSYWLIVIHADSLDGYVAVRKACDDKSNGIKIMESREVFDTTAPRKKNAPPRRTSSIPGEVTQVGLFFKHLATLPQGTPLTAKDVEEWCRNQKSERYPKGYNPTGAGAVVQEAIRANHLAKTEDRGHYKVT